MEYPTFTFKKGPGLSFLVGMALTLGVATASHGTSLPQPADPTFEKYDTNQNGLISKEEAVDHKMSSKAFEEADTNRDGKLNKNEFVKAESMDERAKVAKYVDDSVITAKVKAGLFKHSLLKGLQIHVETYKGAVQLSGFIDSDKQVAAAGKITAGVEGVTKVINNLIPKNND